MTERKTAKPLEAWAVVDKDGTINIDLLYEKETAAKRDASLCNSYQIHKNLQPFRVARVVISEVLEK